MFKTFCKGLFYGKASPNAYGHLGVIALRFQTPRFMREEAKSAAER